MKKNLIIAVVFAVIFAVTAACGGDPHEHDFSGAWKSNDTQHWKECPQDGAKDQTAVHDWDWVETTPATTEAAGLETQTCTVCKKESGETQSIPQLTETPDTCDNPECECDPCEGEGCDCGETPCAHVWGDWTDITVPATCTATGTGKRTCTVCEKTDPNTTIPVDPDAHHFGTDWESDNDRHWHECECGETEGDEAHTVTAWTQTAAPSILADGEETGICTVCGESVTHPIPKMEYITSSSGISMVRLPAGTFQMGSPEDEPNRVSTETLHSVTLTQGFYMGKYQVTQKQWETVMGSLPTNLTSDTYGKGDNYPIYYVSWYDALVFCNKLSVMEGLTPAYSIDGETDPDEWGDVPTSSDATWNAVSIVANSNGYRLPTEAQWEYACRAGTTTAWYTGDDEEDLKAAAWYSENAESKAHEVGKKTANAWGLYDMHGNVWEWCWDWYGTYASGAQSDPLGASSGSYRVIRGGSWYDNGQDLRSAYRSGEYPDRRSGNIGFRLLRP